MRQNLPPSVLERAVHTRQRGEIGRELRELKQGGAVGRVRQDMEGQRAALELRKQQQALLSPDTPCQRPVPARELAAAIRDVYSPATLATMGNIVPELRGQGLCSPQQTDLARHMLGYLGRGEVNAMSFKHGAQAVTPFAQRHLHMRDAISGDLKVSFGTKGICAALSSHWLACIRHGIDFTSDVGYDARNYGTDFRLARSTQGRDDVYSLAIAYYGEPQQREIPAAATADARWVHRDTPYVEGQRAQSLLGKPGALGRSEAVLREHLLDNGLRYREGGRPQAAFDAGSLGEAGYYQIGVQGLTSGHAIAAHIDPAAGRYALFDPNFGEFVFERLEDLRAFATDLATTVYPHLQVASRVARFD